MRKERLVLSPSTEFIVSVVELHRMTESNGFPYPTPKVTECCINKE